MPTWDTIATVIVFGFYVPFTVALGVMAYDAHRRESRTYHRCRAHHPTNNRKGIK